jgi:hypothetical protein
VLTLIACGLASAEIAQLLFFSEGMLVKLWRAGPHAGGHPCLRAGLICVGQGCGRVVSVQAIDKRGVFLLS